MSYSWAVQLAQRETPCFVIPTHQEITAPGWNKPSTKPVNGLYTGLLLDEPSIHSRSDWCDSWTSLFQNQVCACVKEPDFIRIIHFKVILCVHFMQFHMIAQLSPTHFVRFRVMFGSSQFGDWPLSDMYFAFQGWIQRAFSCFGSACVFLSVSVLVFPKVVHDSSVTLQIVLAASKRQPRMSQGLAFHPFESFSSYLGVYDSCLR